MTGAIGRVLFFSVRAVRPRGRPAQADPARVEKLLLPAGRASKSLRVADTLLLSSQSRKRFRNAASSAVSSRRGWLSSVATDDFCCMARGFVSGIVKCPRHIALRRRRTGSFAPPPLQGSRLEGFSPRVPLRSTLGYHPAPLRGLTAPGWADA